MIQDLIILNIHHQFSFPYFFHARSHGVFALWCTESISEVVTADRRKGGSNHGCVLGLFQVLIYIVYTYMQVMANVNIILLQYTIVHFTCLYTLVIDLRVAGQWHHHL